MRRYRAGQIVRLDRLPPDLLSGLPAEDQAAIQAAVGTDMRVEGYRGGEIELLFSDASGASHTVWVEPSCVSDILDVICTSLSVPRPVFVARELLLDMLHDPDAADPDKWTLGDPLFTEIATSRVAELVGTGLVSWVEVARAASVYGFEDTETAKLAWEMAAATPPGASLVVTDDTTDEELSAFIRGKRRGHHSRPG